MFGKLVFLSALLFFIFLLSETKKFSQVLKTKSLYAHTFFYSVRFLLNKCLTELPPIQYIYIFSLDDFIYYIYNFYYRKLVVCGLGFFCIMKTKNFSLTYLQLYVLLIFTLHNISMFTFSSVGFFFQCLLFVLFVVFLNVYFTNRVF